MPDGRITELQFRSVAKGRAKGGATRFGEGTYATVDNEGMKLRPASSRRARRLVEVAVRCGGVRLERLLRLTKLPHKM